MTPSPTPWDGSMNLGDLGGLPLADGGTTELGIVFRSGRRELTTDAGWRQARSAGLATIVDLRNTNEIGRRDTDPLPGLNGTKDVDIVNCPIEDQTDTDFMNRWGTSLSHPRYYRGNLEFFPELIGQAFRVLADCRLGVLVHCSAGRDRTGLISAMLLRLNGVTTEGILDDYEAAVRRYNDELRRRLRGAPEPARSDVELAHAVSEGRDVVGHWIDSLDVPTYLGERCQIPAVSIERLSTLLRPR